MDAEKAIKTYGKNYRTVLKEGGFADIEQKMKAFESRLREMYASENFRKHNIYPTTDATYIYAVMAMCLEIRSFGYSDKDTIRIVNKGFEKRRTSLSGSLLSSTFSRTALILHGNGTYPITKSV